MKYKCIKPLKVVVYDEDGFPTDKNKVVSVGKIYEKETSKYRLIDGEIRLIDEHLEWLEIDKKCFDEHFIALAERNK